MATPSLTAFLAKETRSFLRVRMVDNLQAPSLLINAAPGLGQGCEITFSFLLQRSQKIPPLGPLGICLERGLCQRLLRPSGKLAAGIPGPADGPTCLDVDGERSASGAIVFMLQ
jgi:hypothetical protein